MSDDNAIKSLKLRQLAQARTRRDHAEARLKNLMDVAYVDPDQARKLMEEYRARYGEDAFYRRLQETVRTPAFGRRPGTIMAHGGFSEEAAEKRRQSYFAREDLTAAFQERIEAENHYRAAQRSVDDDRLLRPDPTVDDRPKTPGLSASVDRADDDFIREDLERIRRGRDVAARDLESELDRLPDRDDDGGRSR